jgi:hypothetical protein
MIYRPTSRPVPVRRCSRGSNPKAGFKRCARRPPIKIGNARAPAARRQAIDLDSLSNRPQYPPAMSATAPLTPAPQPLRDQSAAAAVDRGGGGKVHIYSADGKKLEQIDVPEGPANICFGGDDLRTLFITARTSLYSIRMKNPGAKPVGAKW